MFGHLNQTDQRRHRSAYVAITITTSHYRMIKAILNLFHLFVQMYTPEKTPFNLST